MNEWIPLEPGTLNKQQSATINGVKVQTFPSPFDVPDAFRFSYIQQDERVKVEFQYIGGDEPKQEITMDDFMFLVGKRSHRLFSFAFHIGKFERPDVLKKKLLEQLNLMETVLLSQFNDQRRTSNYNIAREISKEHVGQISSEISTQAA